MEFWKESWDECLNKSHEKFLKEAHQYIIPVQIHGKVAIIFFYVCINEIFSPTLVYLDHARIIVGVPEESMQETLEIMEIILEEISEILHSWI